MTLAVPEPPELPDPEFAICPVCGAEMEWVHCWSGCDDGYIDEYDEDPINCDPGDERPCPECRGQGGYLECTQLNRHAAIADKDGKNV